MTSRTGRENLEGENDLLVETQKLKVVVVCRDTTELCEQARAKNLSSCTVSVTPGSRSTNGPRMRAIADKDRAMAFKDIPKAGDVNLHSVFIKEWEPLKEESRASPMLLPIVSEGDEDGDTADEEAQLLRRGDDLKHRIKASRANRQRELAMKRERGEMLLEMVSRRPIPEASISGNSKDHPFPELHTQHWSPRSQLCNPPLAELRPTSKELEDKSSLTRERAVSDGCLLGAPAVAMRHTGELPPIGSNQDSTKCDSTKCPLCGEVIMTGSETEVESLRLHIQTECRECSFLPPESAERAPSIFTARVSALVKLLMADEPLLQLRAVRELGAMAGYDDCARREMVVEESVILPLVYCCRTADPAVQSLSLLALARLAYLQEARFRIARCLSFDTLKRMHFFNLGNAQETKMAGVLLLHNLLVKPDSIRIKLAREGAADMLIQLATSAKRGVVDKEEHAEFMRLIGSSLLYISELAGTVPHSSEATQLAALGEPLLEVVQLLVEEGETLNAIKMIRNICANDDHQHVPSFRQNCVPMVAVVLADKEAEAESKCLALESLNSITGCALRSVDAWVEQRQLVGLVVLSATDRHYEVSRLAWPLLVVMTAGAVVGGKAVEAGVVAAVLEVLVHNRAGLDRESLVMAITCLTNLSAQSALRPAVLPAVPALRPLANSKCVVGMEVAALLQLLAVAEDSPLRQVEADLDIMSVAGDEQALEETSPKTVHIDQDTSTPRTVHPALAELGSPPWAWEVALAELKFNNLVGAGSYAEVYHGTLGGTEVAIKRFRTKHMSESEHCQFLNEVHVLQSLAHPNILRFEAAVATEPHYCIVTEFISPGSLQVVLKCSHEYELPWGLRLKMAADVADGMAYLHSFSPPIVHRDLKPSNLLVQEDGLVKVCDFGTSRQVVPTGTMSVCGTPVYMAPEVLRGERYDEGADLYSYGMVLWELLLREVPFKGVIPVVAGMKIAYEAARPPIPPLETLTDPHQKEYVQLLQQCWAQQSDHRPNFKEVASTLAEWQIPNECDAPFSLKSLTTGRETPQTPHAPRELAFSPCSELTVATTDSRILSPDSTLN